MRGLLGRHRDLQRLRIGKPDVLGGRDDEPAGDEQRILAGLEHASQPVDGGIGIAAANALDERRHDVVVLVAGAVVQEMPLLQGALDVADLDGAFARQGGRRLEAVEGNARVAARVLEETVQRLGADAARRSRPGRARPRP